MPKQSADAPKSPPSSTFTNEWTPLDIPPSTLWEFILRTHGLVFVAVGASLWWLTTTILSQWTGGSLDLRQYPLAFWVDQLFFTTLFVLLLARLVEKSFQLIGPPPHQLPSYPGSQQFQIKLNPENPNHWDQFCAHAKSQFGQAEERSRNMYWAEQGILSVWGSLFVLLGGLIILAGFMAAPYWPNLPLTTQLPLLGLPWIAIGLCLQWGQPQSMIVWWKTDQSIQIWTYSEHAWGSLQNQITQLQVSTASSDETTETPEHTETIE